MAILAILAALVVPGFAGLVNKSRQEADGINRNMIENAIEISYAAGDLSLPVSGTSDDLMEELARKGYLRDSEIELPNDSSKKYAVRVTTVNNMIIKVEISAIPK
jgi:Tfp pilus assembly protein PilE